MSTNNPTKKSRYVHTKRNFFCNLIALLLIGSLFLILKAHADNEFQEKYRAYQTAVTAGKASLNKKDYQAAIDHYTRAIEMSPFVAFHYYDRGIALYRKGDEKKAIEDFDKVIILDPRSSSAYVYRGLCKVKGGDYQRALNDLSQIQM